jgi:hypothetical protein
MRREHETIDGTTEGLRSQRSLGKSPLRGKDLRGGYCWIATQIDTCQTWAIMMLVGHDKHAARRGSGHCEGRC